MVKTFTTLLNHKDLELRLYPRFVCAKVIVQGKYHDAKSFAAKLLNEYLEGDNFKQERIRHSGLYFQKDLLSNWEFSLHLPYQNVLITPKPTSRLLNIFEANPRKIGVAKFRGSTSSQQVFKKITQLQEWLGYKNFQTEGPPRVGQILTRSHLNLFGKNELHLDVL